MALTLATNRQIPDHAIMDHYYKQVYLGNQFQVVVANTSSGTSEVPLILFQNPAVIGTSAATALFINLKRVVELTASDTVTLRAYFGPTFSAAGSAATISNMRPGNANTSVATVTTGPTVSANGTLVDVLSTGANSNAESSLMQILDPGKVMLITIQASASSEVTNSLINWFEL